MMFNSAYANLINQHMKKSSVTYSEKIHVTISNLKKSRRRMSLSSSRINNVPKRQMSLYLAVDSVKKVAPPVANSVR